MREYAFAYIYDFAAESDKIEGILDPAISHRHYLKLCTFLDYDHINVERLIDFNEHGMLRSVHGMNVRVGMHVPPAGGPHIETTLDVILQMANDDEDPYEVHHRFETLHPFTDGNGRTGRALWLWQMWNQHNYGGQIGFLQKWYYQSLDRGR